MQLIKNIIRNLNHTAENAITGQIAGYLGAHLVKMVGLSIKLNPLASAPSFATAHAVHHVSKQIFTKALSCLFSASALPHFTNIAAGTVGIVAGFATYTAISTVSTTYLTGINVLIFAGNLLLANKHRFS